MKLILLAAVAALLAGCDRLPDEKILELTRHCADAGMIAYVDGLDGTVTCRPLTHRGTVINGPAGNQPKEQP